MPRNIYCIVLADRLKRCKNGNLKFQQRYVTLCQIPHYLYATLCNANRDTHPRPSARRTKLMDIPLNNNYIHVATLL